MRVPKTIVFPFGYRVSIKEVTEGEMREMDEEDGAEGRVNDGCWDVSTRTIYLVKTLSPRRKRYLLGHELFHAVVDYQHHLLNEGVMKP